MLHVSEEIVNKPARKTRKAEVVELVYQLYELNKEKNRLAREERRVHNDLLKLMARTNTTKLQCSSHGLNLVAIMAAAQLTKVDVQKLAKLASQEQLLQCVSASQAAVKDLMGSAVLSQCLTQLEGDVKVRVCLADEIV